MKSNTIKKQAPKNLFMNFISLLVNVFIGIWITPYLVKHIGITAYGFIPLALLFSEYVGFIIQSINSAFGRYLIIALQQEDYKEANQTYNTSLVVLLSFLIIQLLIMFIIIYNLSSLIDIPKKLESDVYWIFSLTTISFSLSLVRSFFATTLYAYNRIDLIKITDITNQIFRIATIVILFSAYNPHLKYIGIANIIGALIALIISFYFGTKTSPVLKTNLKLYDKTKVKDLAHTSGWVLVNQIGMILFLRIDLFLTNKFVGVADAGKMAIISQVQYFVKLSSDTFIAVVWPILMIYYARGDHGKFLLLTQLSIKLSGILLGIIIGLLSGTANQILFLWLGKKYDGLDIMMMSLLIPMVLVLATNTASVIQIAANKLKTPALVLVFLGIIKILFVLVLAINTNISVYSIITISVIASIIYYVLFTPLYASKLLSISRYGFLSPLISGFVTFLIVFFLTYLVCQLIPIDSFLKIIFLYLIVSAFSVLIIYFLLISKKEKQYFFDLFPDSLKIKFTKLKVFK